MNFDHLLPTIASFLGVVIGWSLNTFGKLSEVRRENRKPINKVISELLDIRHRLLAAQMLQEEVRLICNFAQLSPEQGRDVQNLVMEFLPPTDDLCKRYDEAVSVIAAFDPILGYQLRSKDYITKSHSILTQLEKRLGASSPLTSEIEGRLSRIAIPYLTEVIIGLGWRVSFRMWWRAKKQIQAQATRPKELDEMIAPIKAAIQAMQAVQVSRTTGQATTGNQANQGQPGTGI